jgi:hypothetical protein
MASARTGNVPEKGADHAVLVAPFRLAAIAHALGLGLEHLALLLGLAVYPVEWNRLQGFVKQAGVLVLDGCR